MYGSLVARYCNKSQYVLQATTIKSFMTVLHGCGSAENLPRPRLMPYNPDRARRATAGSRAAGDSGLATAADSGDMEIDPSASGAPDWLSGSAAGGDEAEAAGEGLGAWGGADSGRGEAWLDAYAAAAADGAEDDGPGGGFDYDGGADDGYHDDEGAFGDDDDDGNGGGDGDRDVKGAAAEGQAGPLEAGVRCWGAGAPADVRVGVP